MDQNEPQDVLQIKKYPNRRYYDTTRSRHITLQEVHDLILQGRDVTVTDSKSGSDITNVVLLQILLEKDHPKLDVFPSSILHMMVRANHQALRSSVEAFFSPFLNIMSQSNRQMEHYWRQAQRGMVNPLEWTESMMKAFTPTSTTGTAATGGAAPSAGASQPFGAGQPGPTPQENGAIPGVVHSTSQPAQHHAPSQFEEDSIDDLRRQLADLNQRLERLGGESDAAAGKRPSRRTTVDGNDGSESAGNKSAGKESAGNKNTGEKSTGGKNTDA